VILQHLVHVVSLILVALTAGLGITTVVAAGYGDGDFLAFLITTAITVAAGLAGRRYTRLERDLSVREGYAVVSLAWLAIGVFGALPYLLTGVIASPVQALFESVSGFTTTGSTIFADIESLPHGILFWRNFTQWIGGMGIIVLGIAVLPFLGVGGMQLFRAEVPGPTPERLQPRITQTAKLLWYVYLGFTVVEATLFIVGGMGPFDAVTHAFTTMSTGGFSTRNASMAAFDTPFIQYVTIAFMYLAGVNFALHYRAVTGRPRYFQDAEWRFFTFITIAATIVVAAVVLLGSGLYAELGAERGFRDALFQVVSLSTTTGYVTYDFELWPVAAQFLLLMLMFMGGMSGSTGGGMKAVRLYVLHRHGLTALKKSVHPKAVILTRVGRLALEDEVLNGILAFILLYITLFVAGALGLTFFGHDILTSIGASASAIGNIGPGLGDVGAVDNFGWLDAPSLLILVFLMLAGRLEILTVLLLFHPDLWRRVRFGVTPRQVAAAEAADAERAAAERAAVEAAVEEAERAAAAEERAEAERAEAERGAEAEREAEEARSAGDRPQQVDEEPPIGDRQPDQADRQGPGPAGLEEDLHEDHHHDRGREDRDPGTRAVGPHKDDSQHEGDDAV
jgi:trk system potassium uptake protein TrkH